MFGSKRTPTPTNIRPVKAFRITGNDVNVTVDVTSKQYELPDHVDSNAIVTRTRCGDKLVIRTTPFEDAFDPRKFPRQPASVTIGNTEISGLVTYDSNSDRYRLETDTGLLVFPGSKAFVKYHKNPTPAVITLNFKQDEFPVELKYTVGKGNRNAVFWTPVYQLFFDDAKKITKVFLKAKVFNMTSEVFTTKTLSFMVSGTVAGAAPKTESGYRAKAAVMMLESAPAAAAYSGGADYEAAKVSMDVAAGYTFEGDFTIKQGESTFPLFEIVGKDGGAIDLAHEVYFEHNLDNNETKYGFRIPEVDRYFPNASVVIFHDRANGDQIKVAETTIPATQPKQELRFIVDKAGEMVTIRVDKTTEALVVGCPEPAYGNRGYNNDPCRTDVYTAIVTEPAGKKVFYQYTGYGFKSAEPKPTRMRGNVPEWEMAADGKNVIKVTHSA